MKNTQGNLITSNAVHELFVTLKRLVTASETFFDAFNRIDEDEPAFLPTCLEFNDALADAQAVILRAERKN